MKTSKKLIAAAVSAVLMLGAMPVSASAAMTGPPASIMQMYERIAEWENVSVDDCIIKIGTVRDSTIVTPNKLYSVSVWQRGPLRVTVKPGTELTPEEVSDAWRRYLTETDRLEGAYGLNSVPQITETETEGTYLVEMDEVWRHGAYIFPDSLTMIPQVEKIEGQYRYHTDDRVNSGYISRILFQCDFTPAPEDFPDLNISSISYSDFYQSWDLRLRGEDTEYGSFHDYYSAYTLMKSLDFVWDVGYEYASTELADYNEDSFIYIDDYEPIFHRGDLNWDGEVDIVDAVLLARLTAEDTDIPLAESSYVNADTDGDGLITLRDVTVILNRAANIQ